MAGKKRKRRNDKKHIVYQLTDTTTGERYIGFTYMRGQAIRKSIKLRFEGHLYGAFVSKNDYKFPKHLREYASIVPEDTKWHTVKQSYLRKFDKLFDREVLEIVRGEENARKKEVELIDSLCPELNTKMKAKVA